MKARLAILMNTSPDLCRIVIGCRSTATIIYYLHILCFAKVKNLYEKEANEAAESFRSNSNPQVDLAEFVRQNRLIRANLPNNAAHVLSEVLVDFIPLRWAEWTVTHNLQKALANPYGPYPDLDLLLSQLLQLKPSIYV